MKYTSRMWLSAALAFGSAAIAGVVIAKTVPLSGGVENPELILPALLVLLALVLLALLAWWRQTDDLQQQGQLLSWYWGGNAGAMIMLTILVVLTGRYSDLSIGAGALFLAEFAGFFVVWLIWKWRGRGVAE